MHSETGQMPIERWLAGAPFPQPTPAQLREAFRWSEHRTVTKTATVSLPGNTYNTDAALVGRKVELVFDPFDMTEIEVRFQNRPFGLATPHRISRHSHPKAKPEIPGAPAAPSTGIDYLLLVDTARTTELGQKINYTALMPDQRGEDK
ncbi:Mu transposase C-terminal domain-containing protein [Streptomyces sp. NPDC057717]|uniref:Mu transposase C-terminal domain-containing protein n=1 Tax=Streptomyces sp. NPDC057717 TaxID=3346224 RepID=UPI0036C4D86A